MGEIEGILYLDLYTCFMELKTPLTEELLNHPLAKALTYDEVTPKAWEALSAAYCSGGA